MKWIGLGSDMKLILEQYELSKAHFYTKQMYKIGVKIIKNWVSSRGLVMLTNAKTHEIKVNEYFDNVHGNMCKTSNCIPQKHAFVWDKCIKLFGETSRFVLYSSVQEKTLFHVKKMIADIKQVYPKQFIGMDDVLFIPIK